MEFSDKSVMRSIGRSLTRPFLLLIFEPMCLLLCLFSAVLLGILDLFFGTFGLVFGDVYGLICDRQVLLSWASLWGCWRRQPRTRYGTRFTKDYSNEIEAYRSPRCSFCLLSLGQFSFRLACYCSPGQYTYSYTGWCLSLAPVCSGWGESTLFVHPAASANKA